MILDIPLNTMTISLLSSKWLSAGRSGCCCKNSAFIERIGPNKSKMWDKMRNWTQSSWFVAQKVLRNLSISWLTQLGRWIVGGTQRWTVNCVPLWCPPGYKSIWMCVKRCSQLWQRQAVGCVEDLRHSNFETHGDEDHYDHVTLRRVEISHKVIS